MIKTSNAGSDRLVGAGSCRDGSQSRLLSTLEQLLAIEATSLDTALDRASTLLAEALASDKSDIFLYDVARNTLTARGTSKTPMGERQKKLGLDVLPIANGGSAVRVFLTGESYMSGQVDKDPDEIPGIKGPLGVKSTVAVPLSVGGERRGVLQVNSAEADKFTDEDLHFLEAASNWVGMVAHRAELVESIAQDVARRASIATAEELIEILAHDMNNYLTPIIGWVGIIRERAREDGNERYLTHAEAAHTSVRRLKELVKDLLDVRYLQYGLFSLSLQQVDLVELIAETLNTMQTSKLSTLLQVREDLTHPGSLLAEADAARVRQALENLLSNALKYSPETSVVQVEVSKETRDGREWATILVRDEGPGISDELMPKLFTRYGAGKESVGLGLGLYLAHSIAVAHGGTLTVDSSPGMGATFRLSLPLAPV